MQPISFLRMFQEVVTCSSPQKSVVADDKSAEFVQVEVAAMAARSVHLF